MSALLTFFWYKERRTECGWNLWSRYNLADRKKKAKTPDSLNDLGAKRSRMNQVPGMQISDWKTMFVGGKKRNKQIKKKKKKKNKNKQRSRLNHF